MCQHIYTDMVSEQHIKINLSKKHQITKQKSKYNIETDIKSTHWCEKDLQDVRNYTKSAGGPSIVSFRQKTLVKPHLFGIKFCWIVSMVTYHIVGVHLTHIICMYNF